MYYQLSLNNNARKMWKNQKLCKKLKRKTSLKSFETIISRICERSKRIKSLDSTHSKFKITKILDEIIGNDYFGTTQNRKRFYHLVNKITTQSRYECVYKSILSKGYKIEAIPWLQEENLDETCSRALLERTNLFLLRFVVKPLIRHFYHALKTYRGYEVRFIERRKWHSFQHKILNELLDFKFLTLPTSKCSSRGVLRIFPKANCDSLEYRPLIAPIKYSQMAKYRFKCISRMINRLSKDFSTMGNTSLFIAWKKYTEATNGTQIYGIKLDVKDAFGNIDIDKLCTVIESCKFNNVDKQFLINHIRNQHVSFQNTLYQWNHGLLQGDRLSSSLCNLFMSVFEKDHLQEFVRDDCFVHRTVDDYFFCSTNKADVDQFEFRVRNVFQLNEAKTERVDGESNCEIIYFGQVFNLNTRQVSKLYSFKKNSSIRHKFKFWNVKHPIPEASKQNIISRTLKFLYNNHCFKKMELNTSFNTEETVLVNYFEGMLFIAFKYEAAVMAVREFQQEAKDMPFLISLLENVVYDYSNITFFKIQRLKGKHYTGSITFRLLKNIAYRAFILVLKKNNEFYKSVIRYVKDKNNLYLYFDNFNISPNIFNKVPIAFEDICLSRRSQI